ncbi:tail protein X [Polycladidibacter hongkongensis]|uniref:tail protein X n=1 Tax=Polycladidibacter hongkongensis TaxID=1647556 RepID=UPI000836CBD1|nr:tail protein X [Pseudovibrio hongkongensis]
MRTIKIAGDNLTLDLLLAREFGEGGAGLLNAALWLNRGVAAGVLLEQGSLIALPDLPAQAERPKRKTIDLFG